MTDSRRVSAGLGHAARARSWAGAALLALLTGSAASAWERQDQARGTYAEITDAEIARRMADAQRGWNTQVGVGVFAAPFYPGADDYRVLPIPFARVAYNGDRFSLGFPDGVRYAVVKTQRVTLGGGLNFGFGRQEENDLILRGLGDVEPSFGPQVFGAVQLTPRLGLTGQVFADVADGHGGVLGDVGVRYRVFGPGRRGVLFASAGAQIADSNFTTTFFSISEAQAQASAAAGVGLQRFDAAAGVTEASFGLIYTRPISRRVRWIANVNAGRLVGDAADSPVTQAAFQARVFSGLAVAF